MTDQPQESADLIAAQEPTVFGTVQKDDNLLIMVSLNNYKGYEYLDLRQWWRPKDEQDYKPTKSGFTLPVKDTLDYIEELIEALEKAKTYLDERETSDAREE